MQKMIVEATEKNDAKYLARLLKELIIISKDFPIQVPTTLLDELGITQQPIEHKMDNILRAKIIRTDEQFRMVVDYVDSIHLKEEMATVVHELNNLLAEYESKKAASRTK